MLFESFFFVFTFFKVIDNKLRRPFQLIRTRFSIFLYAVLRAFPRIHLHLHFEIVLLRDDWSIEW